MKSHAFILVCVLIVFTAVSNGVLFALQQRDSGRLSRAQNATANAVAQTRKVEMQNRQALIILCEQTTVVASFARDVAAAIRLAVPTPARLLLADAMDNDALILEAEPTCSEVGVP